MSLLAERMAALETQKTPSSILAERMAALDTPAETAPVQAAPEEERTLDQNIMGGVNALGQGASFGFADEIGSGLAALAAKATTDTDDSIGDIYNQMMQSEQNKRTAFAKANPKTNLGLNVAGGFATGGLGGAKALGSQAVKNIVKDSALKKALAASTIGSAEGGIAGFGSANQGERLEGAKTGATLGAVLPAALAAGGKGLQMGARPNTKIAPMRQADGSRMPLTLAADDDSMLGNFYRKTVEAAYGGGNLRNKAMPFIQQADDAVVSTQKANVIAKEATRQQVKASEKAIRDTSTARVDELDNIFRKEATESILPPRMDAKVKKAILAKNPQEAAADIDAWIKTNGFKGAKEETYLLDPENVRKRINTLFDDDPSLATDGAKYLDKLSLEFDDALAETGGYIDGKKLMEFRNKYARAANKKDADPTQQEAFRRITNQVDDFITEQLETINPKALKEYKEDMGIWEGFSTLKKSIGKAAKKKGGMFTSDEWLGSTSTNKLFKEQGKLQTQAQANQAAKKQTKAGIKGEIEANPMRQKAIDATATDKEKLRVARERAKQLRGRTTGTSPSNATRLIATTILGSPVGLGGLSGLTGVLPAGALNAKMLSSNTAQDLLAGQAKSQQGVMRLLDRINTPSNGTTIADILRQGTSAGAVAGLPE